MATSKLRAKALSARLALASLGTAVAIGVVCAVGLSSLENTAEVTRVAVTQQLALIDDAAAMSAFQYQKGFCIVSAAALSRLPHREAFFCLFPQRIAG